jgi:hypothetical protein
VLRRVPVLRRRKHHVCCSTTGSDAAIVPPFVNAAGSITGLSHHEWSTTAFRALLFHWRPGLEVTGYWWPANSGDWTPPTAEDFAAQVVSAVESLLHQST